MRGHMVRARYVLALPAALLLVLRCGASAGACAGGSADATGACPGTAAGLVTLGARALRVPLAQLGQPGRPGAPSLLRRAHREAPARLLVRFRPAAVADGAAREYTLREVEARVEALDGIDLGRFLPGARIAVVTLAPGADADEAVARLSLLHGERPTLEPPEHVGKGTRCQALLRSLPTQSQDPQRLPSVTAAPEAHCDTAWSTDKHAAQMWSGPRRTPRWRQTRAKQPRCARWMPLRPLRPTGPRSACAYRRCTGAAVRPAAGAMSELATLLLHLR